MHLSPSRLCSWVRASSFLSGLDNLGRDYENHRTGMRHKRDACPREETQPGASIMSEDYVPPKVWSWNKEERWTVRRHQPPDRGADAGRRSFRLRKASRSSSIRWRRPMAWKVTVMLEELLEAGYWPKAPNTTLGSSTSQGGDQFGSGFVDINPNSRNPRRCSTARRRSRRGSSSVRLDPALSWQKSSAPSRRRSITRAPRRSTGCSGRWSSAPYLGGGFGSFLRLRADERSNTPSIASRWR